MEASSVVLPKVCTPYRTALRRTRRSTYPRPTGTFPVREDSMKAHNKPKVIITRYLIMIRQDLLVISNKQVPFNIRTQNTV